VTNHVNIGEIEQKRSPEADLNRDCLRSKIFVFLAGIGVRRCCCLLGVHVASAVRH